VKIPPETEEMECGGAVVACDTVYNEKFSPLAAYYAAGCLLEAVKRVVDGHQQNGFAVIRPPGHHAEPNEALYVAMQRCAYADCVINMCARSAVRGRGFCFFNNVGVAAAVCTRKWGLARVLIVDWDVHHGNGMEL
jgi:acetoin utilization deacetylase AcuC-like enzyme